MLPGTIDSSGDLISRIALTTQPTLVLFPRIIAISLTAQEADVAERRSGHFVILLLEVGQVHARQRVASITFAFAHLVLRCHSLLTIHERREPLRSLLRVLRLLLLILQLLLSFPP